MNPMYSFVIFLILTVVFFFYRYYYTLKTNMGLFKKYRHRWIYWYSSDSIEGEPSWDYKKYMSRSNLFSLFMWVSFLVSMVFLIIYVFESVEANL